MEHQKKKQKTFSIKAKIIGATVPVVAVLIIIMILLPYTISGKIISTNAASLLESSISYQSESIAGWLSENLAAFSAAKQAIEQTHAQGDDLQTLLDAYYNYNANYPNGLYVADGDFTVDVKVNGSDEIGRMGRSVSHFLESIRGMLYEKNSNRNRFSSVLYRNADRLWKQCRQQINVQKMQELN